jgi:hypothetical protein
MLVSLVFSTCRERLGERECGAAAVVPSSERPRSGQLIAAAERRERAVSGLPPASGAVAIAHLRAQTDAEGRLYGLFGSVLRRQVSSVKLSQRSCANE